MNDKDKLFKELDGLYAVQEIDMELFSEIDSDGNLQIEEDGILVFRIHRMIKMFHTIWGNMDGQNTRKAVFVNIILEWIICESNKTDDSLQGEKEKAGLSAFAMCIKFQFDMFVEQMED